MAAASLFGKLKLVAARHPMVRGMVSYAVLWPTGSVLQQLIEGKKLENFDWARCARFSLYGSLFVAPTLYGWVRLSSAMWPASSLKVGLTKALVEQVSYGPFALSCFYVGMNLLELKSFKEGFAELSQKFWPTLKIGICVWPIVQTINFSLVPEPNRVVVVSIVSVMWTTFLAYMKHLDNKEMSVTNKPTAKMVPTNFITALCER